MTKYDLVGWVRNNNENDTIQLLKDNTNLLKENNSLNKQIQKLQDQLNTKSKEQFGQYTFDELIEIFKKKEFKIPAKYIENKKDTNINALKFFILYFEMFVIGVSNEISSSDYEVYIFYQITPYYVSFDFLERVKLPNSTAQRIHTTKLGSSFYAMLEAKNMTEITPNQKS